MLKERFLNHSPILKNNQSVRNGIGALTVEEFRTVENASAERRMSQRSRVRLSELGSQLTKEDTIQKYREMEMYEC